MRTCAHCGFSLGEEFVFCPKCGQYVEDRTARKTRNRSSEKASYVPAWKDPDAAAAGKDSSCAVDTNGGFGWWILGFLFALVGFILFLSMKKNRLGAARSAANGMLVKLILLAVCSGVFAFAVLNGYIALV